MVLISDPDVWRQSLATADLPPMHARGNTGDEFRASLSTRRLGAVHLAELATPGGECFRAESGVRDRDQGLYQFYLPVDGRFRLEQGGRQAEVGAGDLAVIDPGRPLAVSTTDTRYLTMLVPRRMLGVSPDDLTRLSGRRLPGTQGSGMLLSSLARAAVRSTGAFSAEEADRSGVAIAELTTALLSTQLPRPQQSPEESMRPRVRAFIATRLRDPELSPASVAAAHHISVRRLHQLFRDEPFTVAALIRHSRLERCRAELADPARRDLTLASVAARWGFTDPAHFSRLFKTAYGCTATDYRCTGETNV